MNRLLSQHNFTLAVVYLNFACGKNAYALQITVGVVRSMTAVALRAKNMLQPFVNK